MHLGPDGRVQPVRADQQGPFDFRELAAAVPDECDHAASIAAIPVTRDLCAEPNGGGADTLHGRPVEQHLELAAVNRILRPPVAGGKAPGLGVHVIAVQPDECPLPGLQADRVELLGAEPELVELADGVRLKIDADAERLEPRDRLEHEARHADLMQGQRDAQAADSAARDDDGKQPHCAA